LEKPGIPMMGIGRGTDRFQFVEQLDKLEVAEEIVMPHVVVKLWPGRNDEIKTNLAKRIANVVVEELKVDIGDVSVAFEEVSSSDWGEKVYKKEIRDNEAVYFKPNYEYK